MEDRLASRRAFLRTVGIGAGALAAGPLLAACGDDSSTSTVAPPASTGSSGTAAAAATTTSLRPISDVSLQLGWLKSIQYAGSFIAEEKGYYAAERVKVGLLPGGPNAPVDPPVLQGKALIGVSATDYAARAIKEGAPYKIIGAKNQTHAFCMTSLATKPISNPKALEGARLGVATVNQPVIDAVVKLNNLDASKIKIVPTQGDVAPLVNGEVDVILTLFTSGPVELKVKGIETTSWLLSEYGYNIFSGIYIALNDSLKNKRADVIALMRGEIKGWQDFTKDVAYARDLTITKYAQDQGLDSQQQLLQGQAQLKILVTPDTQKNGLFWMSDAKIAENIKTMGLIGVNTDTSVFDRSILEEIYQGKASI